MTDASGLSGAPAPSAVPSTAPKPTIVSIAKNDAVVVESWFAKHPRAIFALLGFILGVVVGQVL